MSSIQSVQETAEISRKETNCETKSENLDVAISHITYATEQSKNANGSLSTSIEETVECDTRLWIGNLDSRLREYHLLKLVQRYGTIDNFDFLFHRSGPNAGLPRGYAFVTFQDKETAEKCLKSLDGKRVLEKNVAVRWAHQATTTFIDEETKLKAKLPALSMKKDEPAEVPPLTKERAINAIEAKLKAMERDKEAGDSASAGPSFFYHYNKDPPVANFRPRPRPYDRPRSGYGRRPQRR